MNDSEIVRGNQQANLMNEDKQQKLDDPGTSLFKNNQDVPNREERQSLIQNFKEDINKTEDISYYNRNTSGRNENITLSTSGKEKQDKKKKTQKYIIIGVIATCALVLIITLSVTLTKDNNGGSFHPFTPTPTPPSPPPIPTYPFNPYYPVGEGTSDPYGSQTFTIVRNQTYNKVQSGIKATAQNTFFNSVTLSGRALGYKTMRMQMQDTSKVQMGEDGFLGATSSYKDQLVLSDDYMSNANKGVRNEIPLKYFSTKYNNQNEPTFYFSVFDPPKPQTYLNPPPAPPAYELLTTRGCNFVMMTQYLQQGFLLNATRIFGLGERNRKLLFDSNGVYTLYPYAKSTSSETVDDGGQDGGKEKQSSHPFVMAQLTNSNFIGIFLYNTNAISVNITILPFQQAIIDFIAVGGILDFFFFVGPTYQKVLQQYHYVVGNPVLAPYWAHGFHTRSLAFTSQSNIVTAVQGYQTNNFPLESYSLPLTGLKDYINLQYNVDVDALKTQFPTIKAILPFTYVVIDYDQKTALLQLSMAVTVNNEPLHVQYYTSQDGYCMDVFNPNFGKLFLQSLLSAQNTAQNGFWLDSNTPYFKSVGPVIDNSTVNPFFDLPFVPGQTNKGQLNDSTLPLFAQHQVSTTFTTYHYDVHSLYGSIMAAKLQKYLPSSSKGPSFVISDSTFAGSGKFGIGHIFPHNDGGLWQDLTYTMANIINFNMFGVPTVGPNLCGYMNTAQDKELCARFFQLSIICPLAVFNDGTGSLMSQPYNFEQNYKDSILQSLTQRAQFLMYQRTELYKISKVGGALVRPLFADYPTDPNIDPNDLSQVMFGQNIKVDFNFVKGATKKNIYLPGQNWLSANSLYYLFPQVNGTAAAQYGIEHYVYMFQKTGSIIPMQPSATSINTKNVEDLRNIPITLSINLDNTPQRQAHGYVLIEQGAEADGQTEYYYINALSNIIGFKQMNYGQIFPGQGNQNIEKIVVSNIDTDEYPDMACAIMQDYQTIQQLHVSANPSDTRMLSIFITANDLQNPLDTSTLKIDDVSYIFYGKADSGWSNKSCSIELFKWQVKSIEQDDYSAGILLKQNIDHLTLHSNSYDVFLNITMLSDYSIYFYYSMEQWHDYYDTPPYVIDRNFSEFINHPKIYKLADLLTINNNPFYFEIHDPVNVDQIIYSTKDQINILGVDLMILNHVQPNSNPTRFFGIGERKGDFYLKNNYKYVIQSNSNNAPNTYSKNGRVTEYGKSGFFPIIYSQSSSSTNLNAIIHYSPTGKEFAFFDQSGDSKPPRLTTIMSVDNAEYVLIFGLSPPITVGFVSKHIKIGEILTAREKIILPPIDWMFGLFQTMEDMVNGQKDLEDAIRTVTYKWPLEGFAGDQFTLDNFSSMTFSQKLYPDKNALKTLIESNRMAFLQTMNPVTSSNSTANADVKYIFDNQIYVKQPYPSFEPVHGQTQYGTIIFIDYSQQASKAFIKQTTEFCMSFYGMTRIGVQMQLNEITNVYCNGDCFTDTFESITESWFFIPGNERMFQNQLSFTSQRALQSEHSTRNLNGLMQSIMYQNQLKDTRSFMPTISASTTLGSGKLGHVAHVMNYIQMTSQDVALAVQGLQALSLFGNPLVGEQIFYKNIPSGYNPGNTDPLTAQKKFSTFCPISLQHLMPLPSDFVVTSENGESNNAENDINDQAVVITDDLEYVRWRYTYLKYTRTQVFKQLNFGTPFIRPVWFDFPEDDNTYDLVNTQFMYGDAIKVTIGVGKDVEGPMYMPQGYWCTQQIYSSQKTVCNFYNQGLIDNAPETFAWIKQGSIVPMQNPYPGISFNKYVNTTNDLFFVPIDLHVFLKAQMSVLYGSGQLFVNNQTQGSPENFCYLHFDFQGTTLIVTDQAPAMGGTGECFYLGYFLGDIYLYNAKDLGFTNADVYYEGSMDNILFEDHKVNGYMVLKLSTLQIPMFLLEKIILNTP